MPRKPMIKKKRNVNVIYGQLTDDRFSYFVLSYDMDKFFSSWSDDREALETWKLNKDRIMQRWFKEYRTHYFVRPWGYWKYEKNMKPPDHAEQKRLLREWGEITEKEILELAKQEQKQPDAESVQVPNGTIDNDDQELKK